MSTIFNHRTIQDGALSSPTTIRNNSSHVSLGQASMTDHCSSSCPYDDKVVTSGTTARMVLMFMRDLVEPPGYNQVRQCYACPMRECGKNFNEPLSLIQHLLLCPDLLRGGIFDCDKCSSWHQVPTNEKDWEHWSGWKSHPAPFQRKRSFGSKMRETFTIRRKDSARKSNASPEPHIDHTFSLNIRMGSPIEQHRSLASGICPEHHIMHPSHRDVPDYLGPPKIIPDLDRNMFWHGIGMDDISELHSTVSSIAPSSNFETTSTQPTSANTSQTTLFTQGFPTFPPSATSAPGADNALTPQQFMFSPPSTFGGGAPSIRAQSLSAMSIDEEPLSVTEAAVSPGELRPVTSNNNQSWWSPKTSADPQSLTPVSPTCFPIQSPARPMIGSDAPGEITAPTSPCTSAGVEDRSATPGPQYYQMQHSSLHHSMSRTLSQESIQDNMSSLYEMGLSDAHHLDAAASPHSNHVHRSGAVHQKANGELPTEELMCDECQWKPRGVRENLKGYLRKHKNTHKGLRLACEVPGCTKTFSRLDNLKKHKKDKHGMSDDGSTILPSKRMVGEYTEHLEDDDKRPGTGESRFHPSMVAEDYSMLWPGLNF